MEYSPFLERQQNAGQSRFRFSQLDLTHNEPLALHSPTGEPIEDGPLSVQSSVGPSFAEAFSSENVGMVGLNYSGNPFIDQSRPSATTQTAPHLSSRSGFSFSSQTAVPSGKVTSGHNDFAPSSAGMFSSDLQTMSLDPRPQRQRGHRRAQSDADVNLHVSFGYQGTERFDEEQVGNLRFLETGGLGSELDNQPKKANGALCKDLSRQDEMLENIDLEELQNILKSKSAENLSLDPKKAKRIIANRQSAARSKEKKVRYISDLEKRLQQLQSETTSLNTLMTVLQKDTTSLNSENSELKQSLHALESQAQLRDGLNERLRREVMQLKQQAQQLQQRSQARQGGDGFAQDGFIDQQATLEDLLSPDGSLESPTLSSNLGRSFPVYK